MFTKEREEKEGMATKDEQPVDTRDALEVLESEAKEWEKVGIPSRDRRAILTFAHINVQDAEINRILNAFRLDAYVYYRALENGTRD